MNHDECNQSPAACTVGLPLTTASAEIEVIDDPTDFLDTEPEGIKPRIPKTLPILPIRGTVVFPGTIVPLGVGRPATRQLLDDCLPESKIIGLVTQLDEDEEEPGPDGLYQIGVAAMVLKLIRQPDETVSIIVHSLQRIRVKKITQTEPFIRAEIVRVKEKNGNGKKFNATVNHLRNIAHELIELTPGAPEQALTVLMNIDDPSNLVDYLAANLDLDVQDKQDLLEEVDVPKRLRLVHRHVAAQLDLAKLQHKISQDVQSSIGDTQRKIFLREQMKAIRSELGESEDGSLELVEQLRERLEKAAPPEAVMIQLRPFFI